ncbi:MAG: CBS domain-containing protein [Candidatus Heimdallarchaeota archaeon]
MIDHHVFEEQTLLSLTQKEVLRALTDLYRKSNVPVKSEEIAEQINKHEGTVRNQMMSLRALDLVNSIAGPRGGYVPTPRAFEYLDIPMTEKLEVIPMHVEDTTLEVTIADIDLLSVSSPREKGAEIRLVEGYQGASLKTGQNVVLGPTPQTNLIIKGAIIGLYPRESKILLKVTGMLSLPDSKADDLATKDLITAIPTTNVLEATKILAETGIRSLPIIDEEGRVVGLFSTRNLANLAMKGGLDGTVMADYLPPVKISADATFTECLQEMDKKGQGRLLVVDGKEKLIGILTRTDLLHRLLEA